MVALFVVGTILLCIMIDLGIQYSNNRRRLPVRQPVPAMFKEMETVSLSFDIGQAAFNPPSNLLFSESHIWLKMLPSGELMAGIDDLVGRAIGKIERILLPDPGKILKKGDVCCMVEKKDSIAHFVTPFDGVVTYVNPLLGADPVSVQKDPYNRWLFMMKPFNRPENAMNFQAFKTGDTINVWMKGEADRLKTFFEKHGPAAARTGSAGDFWKAFEKEFLYRA